MGRVFKGYGCNIASWKEFFIPLVLSGKWFILGRPLYILLKFKFKWRIKVGNIVNLVKFTQAFDLKTWDWPPLSVAIIRTLSLALLRKLVFVQIKFRQGVSLKIRHEWIWIPPFLGLFLTIFHTSTLMKWGIRKSSHPYFNWYLNILVSVATFLELYCMGLSPFRVWGWQVCTLNKEEITYKFSLTMPTKIHPLEALFTTIPSL